MPKQNRPLVRDGRLQVNDKKKRTDRSYLRPETAGGADAATESAPDEGIENGTSEPMASAVPAVATTTGAAAPARVSSAVRAIQQQGVRKRRDIDLHALGVADTRYAIHEIRRIAVLTVMVVISLVVATIFLR